MSFPLLLASSLDMPILPSLMREEAEASLSLGVRTQHPGPAEGMAPPWCMGGPAIAQRMRSSGTICTIETGRWRPG